MSDEAIVEHLPIFPLSTPVLFPRALVPLHIFEPRYRQMTSAFLEGDRRVGMATVRPEYVREMAGDPPVFEIGCAGLVQQARRREDGRYDLVLLGVHRFRILEEIPRDAERLYRIARIERLEDEFDEAVEGIALQGLRLEVVEELGRLLRHLSPAAAESHDPRRFSGVDDACFVNVLSQILDLSAIERQGLLEENALRARCERLLALLRFRAAELGGGVSGAAGRLH